MSELKHYELIGALLFVVLAVLPLVVPITLGGRALRARRQGTARNAIRKLVWSCALAAALYAAVVVDAFLVETNWPEMRAIEIKGSVKTELRILHLSDLHIEKNMARRDRWLINAVERLAPDLILITGDIHQLGNDDIASLMRVLTHMKAPLGVFACGGYDALTMLRQASSHIVYLQNARAVVRHNTDNITIAGSPRGRIQNQQSWFENSSYGIVLEHTPDRTAQAAAMSTDLYLCGHTHGGQVRIPYWGAIITNSETGKRYEAGLYSLGKMLIHTSRGLGLEPKPAPQVRFFCRPEITLITVVPTQASGKDAMRHIPEATEAAQLANPG